MSVQPSSSFELLDERIRRWIWSQGWTELRDAQERAVQAIIPGDHDVIIAAATAAGKTEAAFLPTLTRLLSEEEPGLVAYISPLKALINDQFGRLDQLCESLEISVWPWHGDIAQFQKTRFLKNPQGVLLITPESLEALFCNRGFATPKIFSRLRYIVVDEAHAFIGTERGKQLQSLMHRLELAAGHSVPRIGLSATLGDMGLAAEYLRPGKGRQVEIIQSRSSGSELKILIKGYVHPARIPNGDAEEAPSPVPAAIASHLFQHLRGTNNLVFPNSRAEVENYTYQLRSLCEEAKVPNEFWPHHGNLSKEIREETEQALKQRERPATAICTSTLELGIDIGSVKSVAQIGPPPSVAALRQRLGRSGRRKGEPAILRGYVAESELTPKSHLLTHMREGLIEFSAMVLLLLEGWCEPPRPSCLHLSTLVQQMLSLIAQHGGIQAADAYRVLCKEGAFSNISPADFTEFLRRLGRLKLVEQESSGLLLHGEKAEPLVNHYSFYAAFASEDEFRLVAEGKTLGSWPVSSVISVGDYILFAGQTWRIESVDEDARTIYLKRERTGRPPLFSSGRGQTHTRVRAKMREIYEASEKIPFLDAAASGLLEEGRDAYRSYRLRDRSFLANGNSTLLFTWLGDAANEALVAMFRHRGINAMACGVAIELTGTDVNEAAVISLLKEWKQLPAPAPTILLQDVQNLRREKWDWALSEFQLVESFASQHLDITGAWEWLQKTNW